MEITIVTIEVMNRIPDWQKRVAGHAQSETSLAIDGGCRGEHWGGGCRKIRNFRVLLMHWTGGWLSGEEEHFESSEKSSCASEPLRAPTTDYQVHRGGEENLSLDWNRHLNAYAVHPLRLIF